jgi:hypothetical protein
MTAIGNLHNILTVNGNPFTIQKTGSGINLVEQK